MKPISQYLPTKLKRWIKLFIRPDNVAVLPGKICYEDDGFATIHNADFRSNPKFNAAYENGLATKSWTNIAWRAHIIAWAAEYALALEGDFIECGVNRGGYSKLIVDYVNFKNQNRKFYLLDTFKGLDLKYVSDAEKKRGIMDAYKYEDCYQAVQDTFKDYSNVILIKGAVPETLPQVISRQIAFVSIDMNCVEPEIAAATAFWDRLVVGGIIVLDDYGHPLHIEQKLAFDRFAAEHGVTILSLPTAQGIIIKPH